MSDQPSPRIVLLSGAFQVRGSSAYTLTLAEHFRELKFEVMVVCTDAAAVSHFRRNRLDIHEVRHLGVPVWRRVVRGSLRRRLEEFQPDLIHVQSRDVLPHGNWLASSMKCPLILTVHDYLAKRERLRFDSQWGRRIIAVSDSVRRALVERLAIDPAIVSVVNSGVDVPDSIEPDDVLADDHVPVVGTASPLEVGKGLHFFLDAARQVLDSGRDVQFLIAGAGPEEANLRRQASRLKIQGNVTFMPNLWDFSASMSAMDIFCLPSLSQGLGTIMFQAMALGRPVIATSVGGGHGVVRDNENALVVKASDADHLANRIIELLLDPARARRIGMAGRATIKEQFRAERMVQAVGELYRSVLSSS